MARSRRARVADVHALAPRPDPFFTTSHVDGHPSVLVRASRRGELGLELLTEVVEDACSRASRRRVEAWRAARAAESSLS